jgi:hypothetical protein
MLMNGNGNAVSNRPLILFLGAFAKLQKASVRFVMPARPSVRPFVRLHGTNQLPLEGCL